MNPLTDYINTLTKEGFVIHETEKSKNKIIRDALIAVLNEGYKVTNQNGQDIVPSSIQNNNTNVRSIIEREYHASYNKLENKYDSPG